MVTFFFLEFLCHRQAFPVLVWKPKEKRTISWVVSDKLSPRNAHGALSTNYSTSWWLNKLINKYNALEKYKAESSVFTDVGYIWKNEWLWIIAIFLVFVHYRFSSWVFLLILPKCYLSALISIICNTSELGKTCFSILVYT